MDGILLSCSCAILHQEIVNPSLIFAPFHCCISASSRWLMSGNALLPVAAVLSKFPVLAPCFNFVLFAPYIQAYPRGCNFSISLLFGSCTSIAVSPAKSFPPPLSTKVDTRLEAGDFVPSHSYIHSGRLYFILGGAVQVAYRIFGRQVEGLAVGQHGYASLNSVPRVPA